jgi:hypothetical protein
MKFGCFRHSFVFGRWAFRLSSDVSVWTFGRVFTSQKWRTASLGAFWSPALFNLIQNSKYENVFRKNKMRSFLWCFRFFDLLHSFVTIGVTTAPKVIHQSVNIWQLSMTGEMQMQVVKTRKIPSWPPVFSSES